MRKGESVLIEKVVNGFIVNPKEVSNLTKNDKDIYIFETMDKLKGFLEQHFNGEDKRNGQS